MSGASYVDGCPCGERFHESAFDEHWEHIRSRYEELRTAAREYIRLDLQPRDNAAYDRLRTALRTTTEETAKA
jgi:hypothetical protein